MFFRICSIICLLFLTFFLSASSANAAEAMPMPSIPENITEPGQRADYLILHYWDNVEQNQEPSTDALEQNLVDFISVLPYASGDSIILTGFANLLGKASYTDTLLPKVRNTFEAYLSNPDSPMRNEELFLTYLHALLPLNSLSEGDRIRTEDKIEMLGKNRKGMPASNFAFTCPDGSEATLYSILQPGKDLLLIFFDPDCENCETVLSKLKADEATNEAIEDGRLSVLAVYCGDNKQGWLRKASTFPSSWTVGINDGEIDEEELYYLPSMPTIYLLDPSGVVIDKNLNLE